MRMRTLVIGILVLFTLGSVQAQSKRLVRKATKEYEAFAYADAVKTYQEIYAKAPGDPVALKVASCYFKMNNIEAAKKWYDKVEDKEHMSHEDHLHYGEVLEELGDYAAAAKWYQVFQSEELLDERAKRKLYGATHIEDYFKDSARFKVSHLPINSEYSDFSPAFYGDGFVFASSRVHEFGTKHRFKWDNSAFLDLYYTPFDEDSAKYTTPKFLDTKINTKFHEGPIAFNKTEDRVIFTRNNYFHGRKHRSDDKVLKLKLYYAERDGNHEEDTHGWHRFKEVPFNSDQYSVGHPTVNDDFTLLVFASDMAGGQGGTDLYFSKFIDGEWADPVNLGPEINTEGNDMFPFLHADGTLYFASNGRGGLGGLDVYEATPLEESDTIDLTKSYEVKDFGYPINSSRDDFGLIMNPAKSGGFFSSNRIGGDGNDDVYEFTVTQPPKCPITGLTFLKTQGEPDATKELLPETTVLVIDTTNGEVIDTLLSGSDASFALELPVGSVYKFVGMKDSLIQDEYVLDLTKAKGDEPQEVELILEDPVPELVCFCVKVISRDSTGQPLEGATVYLMDEEGGLQTFTTNAEGKICEGLKANTTYVAKSTKVKYLADCFVFNTGDRSHECKETELPLKLEKLKIAQKFRYDKILFDLDKSNIRPDAAVELDKVVAFILDHPGITVELGAHTDCRGSDSYNEALSERRAVSSRQYIVDHGVAPDMITAKGYGEYQLTNNCSNGVRCTEEEHQENRRTEIKITGIKDMSVEEEARLQAEIKGLESGVDYSVDCEEVNVIVKK